MSLDLTVGKFIEKERLFHDKALLLCAVSGGIDSMVMLELLKNKGYNLQVAHVNYMLRGQESIEDQKLVETYCKMHSIICHVKNLSTLEVTSLKSGNLQEKARAIRYAWFEFLCENEGLDYVCVAHHQDDVVESFFLNAIRSSGINGLSSIKAINGRIRRPLLSSQKRDIVEYAESKNVPYRNDSSNDSSTYDRNYIRNQIMPILKGRWPQASERIGKSIGWLSDDASLLHSFCEKERAVWLERTGDFFRFGPISEFRKINKAKSLAFHLLGDFKFDYQSIRKMIQEEHLSGAFFSSPDFEAIVDRNYLIFREKKVLIPTKVLVNAPGKYEVHKGSLDLSIVIQPDITESKNIECMPLNSVQWPLTIRVWNIGDIFNPIGMNGKSKKVSDLLINQKINRFEKEDQLVVVDRTGEIIWVVGRRLSETVKIMDHHEKFLKLEFFYPASRT